MLASVRHFLINFNLTAWIEAIQKGSYGLNLSLNLYQDTPVILFLSK